MKREEWRVCVCVLPVIRASWSWPLLLVQGLIGIFRVWIRKKMINATETVNTPTTMPTIIETGVFLVLGGGRGGGDRSWGGSEGGFGVCAVLTLLGGGLGVPSPPTGVRVSGAGTGFVEPASARSGDGGEAPTAGPFPGRGGVSTKLRRFQEASDWINKWSWQGSKTSAILEMSYHNPKTHTKDCRERWGWKKVPWVLRFRGRKVRKMMENAVRRLNLHHPWELIGGFI